MVGLSFTSFNNNNNNNNRISIPPLVVTSEAVAEPVRSRISYCRLGETDESLT